MHNLYNDVDQTAAYWMNQAGIAGTDIGQAIASVYQDSDKALAAALNGAGIAADAIATSLHNLYNDADQTAAYWMNRASSWRVRHGPGNRICLPGL